MPFRRFNCFAFLSQIVGFVFRFCDWGCLLLSGRVGMQVGFVLLYRVYVVFGLYHLFSGG